MTIVAGNRGGADMIELDESEFEDDDECECGEDTCVCLEPPVTYCPFCGGENGAHHSMCGLYQLSE